VIPALPTTSINGITGTWSPAINNSATTTYTFTPTAGQCANTATVTITVDLLVTPTFLPVGPYCSGDVIPALPTTSSNGITGTWSPAINNSATTTYTFTPTAGQCANPATLTINVQPTPVITPIFHD
jgi:serine protease inhibitor